MRFQCPNCHSIVAIDDSECGHPVGCGSCGGVATVPETRFSAGAVINDFVIRKVIGHGGMGHVYLAHQISLDRPVALKVLMEQFSSDSEFIVDFVKEARAAARLNHPNIVQSYAVGEEDGIYFFAMEYVEGETLTELLRREGKLSVEQSINIVQQIAEALDFAWKHQQLVHRDVKPDNIMLTNRGVAKLADLGLARAASELLEDLQEDEVMGTPQYICPEQLLGQPMDTRGDIYSLGATFYQMATARFPFEGKSAAEIARKHLQEPLIAAHDVDTEVPETVSWVISRMMAKKAEDRYPDGAQLVTDLGLILRGDVPQGYTGPKPGKPIVRSQRAAAPAVVKADPEPDDGDDEEDVEEAVEAAESSSGAKLVKKGTGKKTKLKIGGKKTRSRLGTSTKAAAVDEEDGDDEDAPAAVTPAARAAARSAKPPAKSKLPIILGVVGGVVFLGILAGIIFYLQVSSKYSLKSPAQAEKLYFANHPGSTAEQDLYEQIKPYIGNLDTYKNDQQELNKALTLCRNFMADYPGSLFCQTGQVDYAQIFRAPGIFADRIAPQARSLVGIVPATLAEYEEQLIRLLRQERHEEELTEVKTRREDLASQQAWDDVAAKVRNLAKQRIGELNREKARLAGVVAQMGEVLQQEQMDARRAALDNTYHRNFISALAAVRRFQLDKSKYPRSVAPDVSRISGEDEASLARRHLRQIERDHDGIELRRIENEYNSVLAELKLKTIKDEIAALPESEEKVMINREGWLNDMLKTLETAQAFHNLVAGTFAKFKDQKIDPGFKLPSDSYKAQIDTITNDSIIVRIVELDFRSGKFIPKSTRTIPFAQVPLKEFVDLARTAFGDGDPDEYELKLGTYLFCLGYSKNARASLEKVNGPIASFVLSELDPCEPVFVELRVNTAVERLKEYLAEDKAKAKAYFEYLQKTFADQPAFQAREGEIRQLLGIEGGEE